MPLLQKIIWNRRHLIPAGHLSIWITSQKYRQIPYQIRVAFTHLIIFKLSNTEMNAIIEEHCPINVNEFKDICNYVYQKPHDFLFMCIENDFNNMFYRNFNKLKISNDKNIFNNFNGTEKNTEKNQEKNSEKTTNKETI